MTAPPPPPPRRTNVPPPPASTSTSSAQPEKSTWSSRMKAKGTVWGKKAIDKGVVVSDNIGGKVNDISAKHFGTEHFWPVTGDFVGQFDKCARILRSFTVEGVVKEETEGEGTSKTKKKILRKIPPAVMRQAKGVAIFTSMRTGIAPFGGAGGAGLVMAKLPDGSWSAPASISPNNLSAGFLLGVDVYDCVLVLRSQAALDSFSTHKATLGAEIGVTAGPFGSGAAVESGIEKAPVFSYVKSRGLYAGVELVGQVFVERFEENAAMYHWPGVKAGQILAGKVRVPVEAAALITALQDAETGRAQMERGEPLDLPVNSAQPSRSASPGPGGSQPADGEMVKLPPRPDQTDGTEEPGDEGSLERVREMQEAKVSAEAGSGAATPGPPLPPRPSLNQIYSSESHYSTETPREEMEGEQPPRYEEGAAVSLVRDEKASVSTTAGMAEQRTDATGAEQARQAMLAGMSDAEKREWEEHWKAENAQIAQSDDEALRKALEQSKIEESARPAQQPAPTAGGPAPPYAVTSKEEEDSLR